MPRPRKRKETVIISLAIERELAFKLRELARARSVSVSSFAEQLLYSSLQALGDLQIPNDPLSPADPPQQVDPLFSVRFEEFEKELADLEERLSKLEAMVKRLPAGGFRAGAPLGEQASRLRKWLWDLDKAWKSLHREYGDLQARVEAEKARRWNLKLAELRRRWLTVKRFLYAK